MSTDARDDGRVLKAGDEVPSPLPGYRAHVVPDVEGPVAVGRTCTVCVRALPGWEPGDVCAACWRVARRVAEQARGHVVGVSAEGVRVDREGWFQPQMFPWPTQSRCEGQTEALRFSQGGREGSARG